MKITIKTVTDTLIEALERNAPVRGENMPASWSARKRINYLKPTKTSPHPGNLKDNGINIKKETDNHSQIGIGGEPAVYANATEEHSFKPGWMARSEQELLDTLRQAGGRIR